MKAAGIARALLLASTITLVGMLFAGSVAAAPLSKQIDRDSEDMAVDGTDVYWTLVHKSKAGKREMVLYRGSFLYKARAEIARFDDEGIGTIDGLSAGGGYVVVSLNDEHRYEESIRPGPTSQILRISRDGSRRDVVATGRIRSSSSGSFAFKNGVAYPNDCGTRVRALGVSASGSIAIESAVSDRRSKSCGRKKDVDHWRYYEQRLDGSQREIFAKDTVVRSKYKRTKVGYEWSSTSGESEVTSLELVGDRALIRSSASAGYFVRDLVSGTLSGPFGSASSSRKRIEIASLSSNGAVALNTFSVAKRTASSERIGVFPSSTDPTVFQARKGGSPLQFCGSHLLSVSISGGKLQELDPVTFAPLRTLATRLPSAVIVFGVILSCGDNYVYAIDLENLKAPSLLAYPL